MADTGDFFVYDQDLVPKHPDFLLEGYDGILKFNFIMCFSAKMLIFFL